MPERVNELDKASTELDSVIGNVVHGNMDPDMAADWIEYESNQIVETFLEMDQRYVISHHAEVLTNDHFSYINLLSSGIAHKLG